MINIVEKSFMFLLAMHISSLGFLGGSVLKNLPASVRDTKHKHLITVGKIPQSRKWQLTPLFLPGKSHGQRSLLAYNPRGHKEWDTTEHSTKIKVRRSTLTILINILLEVFFFSP